MSIETLSILIVGALTLVLVAVPGSSTASATHRLRTRISSSCRTARRFTGIENAAPDKQIGKRQIKYYTSTL